MTEAINNKTLMDFYLEFKKRSPIFLFFFMLFTCGFYLINWIYKLNRRFEEFDNDNSPDSKRGLIILFMIPFIWFFLIYILKIFVFVENVFVSNILYWVDIVVWFGILFLVLQYLYDFCRCFGKFTMSNGFVWYMFLWVGFFPLVLIPFGIFYFLPILGFPIVIIPLMQFKINLERDRYKRKHGDNLYYKNYGSRNI